MNVFSDPLYRKSLIIMVSSLVGGALNYLYNPLVARLLTTAQYGELLTMFAVLNVIAIPANTNSILTTQFVSRYTAVGDERASGYFVKRMYRQAWIAGAALFVVFFMLTPLIQHFFHFSSGITLVLLGISIPTAFIYPVVQGVIQGRQQFMRLSVINLLGPAIKLIGVAIAMIIGFRLLGIVGLLGVGSIVMVYVAFLWARLRSFPRTALTAPPSTPELLRRGSYALLANIGLAILLNIDLFIAKRYLAPDLAGQYGTISLLGKAVFFFGGSLALVLFPMVLSRHAKNESSRSIIAKALSAIVLITISAVALFALFSPFIIRVLFGSRYLNFSSVLWLTGVVFGLYSVIHILVTYFLATPSRRFLFPLLSGCFVIPLAFTMGPHTVQFLMYVMAATFTAIVFLLLFLLKSVRMNKDQLTPITVIEPPL
ncbi:MAG: oligosaccharide flippase family protein [Candidatus Kerfeldbacteria bacterium]